MYVPPAFRNNDAETLWEFVRARPLALLVSHDGEELLANLIPFEVIREGEETLLRAHLARANGQWRSLDGRNVLVVWQGSDAYVSPQWYASKREHGKVVPTWNYAVVQARGLAKVNEDTDWLRSQVARLTTHHEAGLGGEGWKVTDAPEDFIDSQLKGIVGIEIRVTELKGKFKASQNRSSADISGVASGLAARGDSAMAAMVTGKQREA